MRNGFLIAASTRLITRRTRFTWSGFVDHACACVGHLKMLRRSWNSIGTARSRLPVWCLDIESFDLMLSVIDKLEIPYKQVLGFGRFRGRWFVRLVTPGWISVSDLLTSNIKLINQTKGGV